MNRYMIMVAVAAAGVSAASPTAAAQELHEQIGVDGKYVRSVTVQDRVHALPTRMRLTMETSPMPYNFDAVTTNFLPSAAPLDITMPYSQRQAADQRGYLSLSLGSWLDGNLSAGYRFIDKPATTMGAYLQVNTTSYFKPKISEPSADVSRQLADGRLGLYATHNFEGKGALSAQAEYRLGWFNYFTSCAYLPLATYHAGHEWHVPSQTINEFNARVAWSAPKERRTYYHAALGVNYFGYHDYPEPVYEMPAPIRPAKETQLSLTAGLARRWQSGSSLGADIDARMLIYPSEKIDGYWPGWHGIRLKDPENYGVVTLKPFYRFSHGLLNLRIGAAIDLSFNAGPRNDRYSVFHIAPDVRLDWRKKGVGLYLNVLGGSRLLTLPYMHQLEYYCMPALATTRPVYTPLDGELGANFGPFAGFSAGLKFAYRVSRATPTGGWFMAMLNYGSTAMPGLELPIGADYGRVPYSASEQGINLHGMSAGIDLKYQLGKLLEIAAQGSYQPQNGKTGYFNGYDRPRWILGASATVRPFKPLSITVEYQYRGVRNIYTNTFEASTTAAAARIPVVKDEDKPDMIGRLRLPDITLLNARIGWQFTPRISAFVAVSNLLDRCDLILPCLPQAGITAIAGAQFTF